MAKKKNDGDAFFLVMVVGFLMFLPFLVFTFLKYRRLKKQFHNVPNIQRVYDLGLLTKTIGAAIASVVLTGLALVGLIAVISKIGGNNTHLVQQINFILICAWPLVMVYPMKKMAERVAVRYYGVVFNDNNHCIYLPADVANISLGDYLRFHFLRKLGDIEKLDLSRITNITREKGVNFYIHGDFGSRIINFSSKQKRDECLSALQARTRVRPGRDLGY